MSIRKIKARKAVYGYEVKFNTDMDKACVFMAEALQFADVTVEYKQQMAGVDVVKVYTDTEVIANHLERFL